MTRATAKATDKVKVTAKDGGETSPTPTRAGGEAKAREIKATQEKDTTEKSPKKSHKERAQKVTAITAISQDTSAENAEKG